MVVEAHESRGVMGCCCVRPKARLGDEEGLGRRWLCVSDVGGFFE